MAILLGSTGSGRGERGSESIETGPEKEGPSIRGMGMPRQAEPRSSELPGAPAESVHPIHPDVAFLGEIAIDSDGEDKDSFDEVEGEPLPANYADPKMGERIQTGERCEGGSHERHSGRGG